ncbi:hypothetical protein Mterra_00216 [Calidithermus terrae]|uniref:Phospholipase D-like domain-containing protein n=1 Tax=Calidithermus terrae TaxID=1408545 RepID=A0A399F751_9DEIN|nr:hypothetical protein [Calidithermus terrae]RIH90722.1 hypothetical protein Mterra_00216 [Calidithermus terrae]
MRGRPQALLALLLGVALARQPGTEAVASVEQVAALIDQAQRQVVYVAPGLYSPPVAQALHRAAVQRGVQVLVLLEASQVNEPSSYGAALAFLAPERPLFVRVVQAVRTAPRLLLDSRVLVEGPLVAGDAFDPRPTALTRDYVRLAVEVDRFNRTWEKAGRCRPTAYLAAGELVLRCRI